MEAERESGRPALTRLLVVAGALAMLGYRLLHLEQAPFIRDEPFFLEAARQEVLTGHWVLGSPIVGGQGIPYGPSVLWFYGAVQTLFGPSALACITAMCALVSGAHLALAAAVTRMFRGGAYFFATVLAFIASSPHQFFWSRLAWDQLVNALSALTIAILCAEEITVARGAAIGLCLGLAISSHLMVAPLAIIVGVALLVGARHQPARLARLVGATLGTALLVNLPYLVFLSRATITPGDSTVEDYSLALRILEPVRAATLWKIDYFFDRAWPRFLSTSGFGGAWPALAPVVVAVCAALAFGGLALMIARGEGATRRIGAVAAATIGGYALFYAAKGLPLEPHYQFATWWAVPVGLAGALALSGRARAVAYALVWLVALVQLAFIVTWRGYISAETGTRGVHYGPPLSHQRDLVRQACAAGRDGELLRIVNRTAVFRGSLDYLGRVEPSCARRQVVFCTANCPPITSNTRSFELVYDGERDSGAGPGRLALHEVHP